MNEPERVTQYAAAHEQLLYFTSTSLDIRDERLIFISDRTGHPNLFDLNLTTGVERQLSWNTEAYLKSYVYFDGRPYSGLGKASPSFHAASGTLYYLQGVEIRKVDAEGKNLCLATLPRGHMTAFTHVSEDGKRLCVPCTDEAALDGTRPLPGKPEYDIDARVQAEKLSSYLRVYDTQSGELLHCEPVPRAWITHVQFSPQDSGKLLYNHEWPADCGIRRMWYFDGKDHLRLRHEGNGRSRDDFTCHEMWEREGAAAIYHGIYADGTAYLGRVVPETRGVGPTEIALSTGCARYGHFTVGQAGVLVSDGYYEQAGDREGWAGDWICRVDVDWEQAELNWTPLCRSGSSWRTQDEHPHPIIDHHSQFVYFTSDRDGRRAIYRIPLSGN